MPLSGVISRYVFVADEQREPFDIYCLDALRVRVEAVSIRMQCYLL